MESETVSGTCILSGLSIDPAYNANGWLTDFTATKGANASYDVDYGFDAATGQLASVTHTAAGRSAHYQYHPTMNRALHVDFKHGNTTAMRSSYLYDRAGRLETVRSHLTASGDVVSSHGYRYDPANRRVEARREDGSFWKCGYNSKGELIDSNKYLPGEAPLAGYQWDYGYDE